MSYDTEALLAVYKSVKHLHTALHAELAAIKEQLPSASPQVVADTAFILRRCEELLDDSRKSVIKLKPTVGNIGVMWVMQQGGGSLQGKYCRAHGKATVACQIPSYSKDPAGYAKLCEIFGLPCNPALRLHWPAMQEIMSTWQAQGKPIPKALEQYKQYTENQLIAVARADATLDSDAERVDGITEK